jgi:hypothetical protein
VRLYHNGLAGRTALSGRDLRDDRGAGGIADRSKPATALNCLAFQAWSKVAFRDVGRFPARRRSPQRVWLWDRRRRPTSRTPAPKVRSRAGARAGVQHHGPTPSTASRPDPGSAALAPTAMCFTFLAHTGLSGGPTHTLPVRMGCAFALVRHAGTACTRSVSRNSRVRRWFVAHS